MATTGSGTSSLVTVCSAENERQTMALVAKATQNAKTAARECEKSTLSPSPFGGEEGLSSARKVGDGLWE